MNDLAMVEGGHSVVSGDSDGSVHVWRVDMLSSSKQSALSNEVRAKLEAAQPATLGAAARIPGVTPAAVVALLRFVQRKEHKKKQGNAA